MVSVPPGCCEHEVDWYFESVRVDVAHTKYVLSCSGFPPCEREELAPLGSHDTSSCRSRPTCEIFVSFTECFLQGELKCFRQAGKCPHLCHSPLGHEALCSFAWSTCKAFGFLSSGDGLWGPFRVRISVWLCHKRVLVLGAQWWELSFLYFSVPPRPQRHTHYLTEYETSGFLLHKALHPMGCPALNTCLPFSQASPQSNPTARSQADRNVSWYHELLNLLSACWLAVLKEWYV
jgi:hypothetical protein